MSPIIERNIQKKILLSIQCFFRGGLFSFCSILMRASWSTEFGIRIHIKIGNIIISSAMPIRGKNSGSISIGFTVYTRDIIAMISFVFTGVLSSMYARVSTWISFCIPRIFFIFWKSFIRLLSVFYTINACIYLSSGVDIWTILIKSWRDCIVFQFLVVAVIPSFFSKNIVENLVIPYPSGQYR